MCLPAGCCGLDTMEHGHPHNTIGRRHHHKIMHCTVEVTPSSDTDEVAFDKAACSNAIVLQPLPQDCACASSHTVNINASTVRHQGDVLVNNIFGHQDITIPRPMITRQRVPLLVASVPKLLPCSVNVSTTQIPSVRHEHGLLRPASSHSSLTSCASSVSMHSDLCSPGYLLAKSASSYGIDVPAHHQGVLKVIETWMDVCCIDFEFNSMMKKEVKDFFKKMSSLGPDYDTWSQKMQGQLHLQV